MSSRSKREHKPTSKFLKYCTEELHSNKAIRKSLPKTETLSYNINKKRKLEKEEIKPIETPTKKVKSDSSLLDSAQVALSSSSEIRRSGRQAKPNEKLKAFAQVSLNSSKDAERLLRKLQEVRTLKPILSDPDAKELNLLINKAKVGKTKTIVAVSPVIRNEVAPSSIIGTRHLSVGLSRDDVFVNPLLKSGEASKKNLDTNRDINRNSEIVQQNNHKVKMNSVIKPAESVPKRIIIRKGGLKTGIVGPITGKVIHITDATKKMNETISSKTMKNSEATSSVDNANQRTIRVTRKKIFGNKLTVAADPVEDINKARSPNVKKLLVKPNVKSVNSTIRNKRTSNETSNLDTNKRITKNVIKPKSENLPQKDIKETLQKFLNMGHNVANSISETLKINEEELLSKSSTFEKKCINLVQSVAKASSDISEEDMEMILTCLDEAQEERIAYRKAFLESLKVAHLTNMALYSQMIRVLHTL